MGNCSASPATQPSIVVPPKPADPVDAVVERAKRTFDAKYAQVSGAVTQLKDFQLLRTVGTGSFARVMQVKRGDQLLALKIMKKEWIVEFGQVKHILSERQILHAVDHPFIVDFVDAFKDNAQLYLVLEFVPGGEMFSDLRKLEKYSEERARFYAAQIVLALEYLHHLHIIFRNIKPEDILFAADGYLKLVDFGFAKVIDGRTFTLCGTPDYLAPETVIGIGQTKGVDYWALGVLIYEMTSGTTPFAAEVPTETYKKIITGKFDTCEHFSSELVDLLEKLLRIHSNERYGCLAKGADDVKDHGWFQSIDWLALTERRLLAPFIPEPDEDYYEQYSEEPPATAETNLFQTEFETF